MSKIVRSLGALAVAGSLVGGSVLSAAPAAAEYQKYRVSASASTKAECDRRLNFNIFWAKVVSKDRLSSKVSCYRQQGSAAGSPSSYYGYAWMLAT